MSDPHPNSSEEAYLRDHGSEIEDGISHALRKAIAARAHLPLRFIAEQLLRDSDAPSSAAALLLPRSEAGRQQLSALDAAESSKGVVSLEDHWSPLSWVSSSLQLPSMLLEALSLPPDRCQGTAAREHIAALDTTEKFESLLTQANLIHTLATQLCEAASKLRVESKEAEQPPSTPPPPSKFSQSPQTLTFGPISLFFSGLERLVGAPHPMIHIGMRNEHLFASDSHEKFTTPNYQTSTTSRIEWHFVADPEDEELLTEMHGRWPEDVTPPSCKDGQSFKREPRPLRTFEDEMRRVNEELEAAGEPQMLLDELIGSRLYTGPMFVKYNTVLRAQGAQESRRAVRATAGEQSSEQRESIGDEPSRSSAMEQIQISLCMDNLYTTTLHVINSAIIKLSKTTKVSKVYRGLSGRVLPLTMLEANRFATRGGVEFAFLSTSTERSVAENYSGGHKGVIFEIKQGLTDRGASIAWLSQYSLEAEVLFPPLSALEVLGWRHEGQKIIFDMRLSVNLTSEPIERVVAKFKNASLNLLKVLRSDLHSSGAPQLSLLSLDGVIQNAQVRDHRWYNVAENYQKATIEAFDSYRGALKLLALDDMWRGSDGNAKRWRAMRKLATSSASSGEFTAAIEILQAMHKHMGAEGLRGVRGRIVGESEDDGAGSLFHAFPSRRVPEAEARRTSIKAESAMASLSRAGMESVREDDVWRLEVAAIFLAEGARVPFPALLIRMVMEGGPGVVRAFARLVGMLFTEDRLSKGSHVLVLLVSTEKGEMPGRVMEHRWKEARMASSSGDKCVVKLDSDGREERVWSDLVLPFDPVGNGSGALLREASYLGSRDLVESLIEEGRVHVREADGEGTTSLHKATQGGHAEVRRILLISLGRTLHSPKKSEDLKNRLGKRALDYIFENRRSHLLRVQDNVTGNGKENGADRRSRADVDFDNKVIPTELEQLSDPPKQALSVPLKRQSSSAKPADTTPLNLLAAALRGNEYQLVQAIHRPGADINRCEQGGGLTPLMLACRCGSAAKVDKLIQSQANVNLKSRSGCTALVIAAEAGQAEKVRILLENDANVDESDESGATPLTHAAFNGHGEVATILLEYKANPHHMTDPSKRDADFSPLHRASLHGHLPVVKALLKAHADVEQTKEDGYHALMLACLQGQIDVARELIYGGSIAILNKPNNKRHTALMAASKNGHTPTVRLLLQARASVNDKDNDMMTPLLYACENGAEDCVEVLLKEGADIHVKNNAGRTPLRIAKEHGDVRAVSAIEEESRRRRHAQ